VLWGTRGVCAGVFVRGYALVVQYDKCIGGLLGQCIGGRLGVVRWPQCRGFAASLLRTSLHLPDAIAQVTLPWCSAACDAHPDCTAFSHQRRRAVGVCKLHGPMAASASPSHKASLQSSPDVWKLSVSPTWEVRDAQWVHSRRPETVWRHAALDEYERAAPSARETLARRSQVRTARPTLSACASSPTRCACMRAPASALGRAFLGLL
jgi:hypothetical protein